MGLFSLFKSAEPVDVYCQACGENITGRPVDVSGTGKAYCHGDKPDGMRCGEKALLQGLESGATVINVYMPKEIPKAIKKKELTSYNPLA